MQNATQSPNGTLQMTHFGAAGWRFTDGKTTVLLDPYFSRLKYKGKRFGRLESPVTVGDTRPAFGPEDEIVSDTDLIDQHIDAADYIVISHSHFNHCMDMPYIAQKTGAVVIGTESTMNVARAGGVDDDQLLGVKGGEDYEFGEISIRVLPGLHSPLAEKRYFEPCGVPHGKDTPLVMGDYCEGNTLAYYIRWGAHRIVAFGSMNYIERELFDLPTNIVLVAAAEPRLHIHDYTGRLLRRLDHPPLVIATHWDIQTAPYGASQDGALKQAETFVAEVRDVSPDAEVVVPRHFDTIHVDKAGKVIKVENTKESQSTKDAIGLWKVI